MLDPALSGGTDVWSYQGQVAADPSNYSAYLGPTIVVESGAGLHVSYTNQLGTTYPNWVPLDVDFTPGNANAILPMTHLHGGFVQAQFDGNPAVDGEADLRPPLPHRRARGQRHDAAFCGLLSPTAATLSTRLVPTRESVTEDRWNPALPLTATDV